MRQVVTSENLVQFVQTGQVPEFKAPEPAKPAATIAPKTNGAEVAAPAPKETSAVPARDDAGKFTKQNEGDKSKTASAPPKKEVADEDLSEVVRQKIDKKHRQMKEAEEFARSEALRAMAAERRAEQLQQQLEAAQKSGPAPAKSEVPKEPKPDDFATVAEYTDALVTYRVDQRLRDEQTKREREAAEREHEARQREFGKRLNEAKAKHGDFEDVLASIKGTELERVHSDVTEYIQESDQGGELLYHLAKNPDVLDRLRKLSPRKAVAELGKLEAKWEAPAPAKEETPTLSEVALPTARPVSKAPAPIAPIDSSGIAPVAKKPDEMSVQELREYRRQQDREKRASGR
jgi:hypothetical protein